MVAADLGIDRVEFRRKNLITRPEQPYPIATIVQPTDAKDEYDSGDYQRDARPLPEGNRLDREGRSCRAS